MRITLDIDDRIMRALMARYPGRTEAEAVEAAIVDHLRGGGVEWLLDHAGQIEIEDVSAELRAADRRL